MNGGPTTERFNCPSMPWESPSPTPARAGSSKSSVPPYIRSESPLVNPVYIFICFDFTSFEVTPAMVACRSSSHLLRHIAKRYINYNPIKWSSILAGCRAYLRIVYVLISVSIQTPAVASGVFQLKPQSYSTSTHFKNKLSK